MRKLTCPACNLPITEDGVRVARRIHQTKGVADRTLDAFHPACEVDAAKWEPVDPLMTFDDAARLTEPPPPID